MTAGANAKDFLLTCGRRTLVVDLKEVATDLAKEKGKREDGQEDARVLYVGLTGLLPVVICIKPLYACPRTKDHLPKPAS